MSGLWDLNKKKVEKLLSLLVFGVLEVKGALDRTGMKIYRRTVEISCIGMWHPDALLAFATIGQLA